ncbi:MULTISPECIES: hypothetical protein [unclassified Streptomyces]
MPTRSLTRRERLAIICTVLGSVLSGTARALTAWILDQLSS